MAAILCMCHSEFRFEMGMRILSFSASGSLRMRSETPFLHVFPDNTMESAAKLAKVVPYYRKQCTLIWRLVPSENTLPRLSRSFVRIGYQSVDFPRVLMGVRSLIAQQSWYHGFVYCLT